MLAYALDESVEGTTRSIDVTVDDDGSVTVADDGRGTDTRRDESGAWRVKPVMATPDLRFFAVPSAPPLADGVARSGMSVVTASSAWLEHVNVRGDGAWSARYERGLPVGTPRAVESGRHGTGTVVRFLPDPMLFGPARVDARALGALLDGIASPAHVRLDGQLRGR